MPLSPLEAASRVNEQVTVEMLVKAAKTGVVTVKDNQPQIEVDTARQIEVV
jgi:hypothetical protein